MDVPRIFIFIKDPAELAACWNEFVEFYDSDEGRAAKNKAWLSFQHAWMAAMEYATKKDVA